MSRELLVAILAGTGGMLGWGFADFFAKKTIDTIGDVASLAWAGVFGTAAFIPIVLYEIAQRSFVVPADAPTWLGLIFFGALQAAVYLFAYNGFRKGQIAVLNPVFASFAGWAAFVSIFFLGEVASGYRIGALGIIFAGLMLLSIDFGALRERRFSLSGTPGFWEVAVATILAAAWTLLWDKFVSGNDAVSYAFWMFLCMTVAVFIVAFVRRLKLSVPTMQVWVFVALIGICETVAYLAITAGYSMTTLTSVVALLSGAFSLPTIILARLFLGERPTVVQTVGSIVIIAGVVLLPLV